MFQKPARVKTQTAIKGSDRKRLRSEVHESFPHLSHDDIHTLIPTKDEMTCAKVTTHAEQAILIYFLGKNPIFCSVDKKIIPTVYTLWMYPQLVPCFTTWPVVFTKLAAGADLMLPGVVIRGKASRETLPDVRLGDCCSVSLVGNRSPMAVGVALMDSDNILRSRMRGKGVKVTHCYGDYLWSMGDKSEPPMLMDSYLPVEPDDEQPSSDASESVDSSLHTAPTACVDTRLDSVDSARRDDVDSTQIDDAMNTGVCLEVCPEATNGQCGDYSDATIEASSQADTADETTPRLAKEDMDKLLYELFLTALKVKLTKADLPMLTSAFYRKCMLSCCPATVSVDIRQSSYKKLSKFLGEMQNLGLVKIKETSRGVDSITEMDKTHRLLKAFEPKEEYLQEGEATPTEPGHRPPVIVEKRTITSQLLPLVSGSGLRKGQAVGVSDIRDALTDYIRHNELQDATNKMQVTLDPILAQVVLRKGENDVTHMKWEDVIRSCVDKAPTVCEVSVHGQPTIIHKGGVEPVSLDVKQRACNKKVTLVDNIELYGIDPEEFSQRIKHAVACSVSVVDTPQKHKGHQVVVQGNQVDFISRLLLDVYQLPPKYIKGMEKAVKKKR